MDLLSYPRAYFELLIVAISLMLGISLSSAFLPIFAHELDPSEILVGFVSSAWFISRIFTELPSGMLSDRLGRRKIMIVGLAISTVGAFLCSTAMVIQQLIIGRALWGLGIGFYFMTSSATIFDLFESKVRGRALGTFHSLQFIGGFVGAPLGSIIASVVGYNSVFLIASALMFLSFFVAFSSKGLKHIDSTQIQKRVHSNFTSLKEIMPGVKRWNLTSVYFNSFSRLLIMAGVTNTVFPLYLTFEVGLKVEMIGLIVSIRTVGVIISTITSGHLSDRFGRKITIITGLVGQSVCMFLLTVFTSYEYLLVIGFVEGVGRGMVLTSIMVLLSDVVPVSNRGGAIGVYRTFMDLGGLLGPLIFMILYNQTGSFLTFMSAAVIFLLNAGLIISIRTSKEKSTIVNEL